MKSAVQHGVLSGLGPREAVRWIGAGTVALALHGGGLWYSQQFKTEESPSEPPPSVVMMDLAPLVVETESVAAEEAPAVETAETVTETASTEELVEEEVSEVVTETPPEPIVEEVEPEPVEEEIAEAPEAPKPEVVVPKRVERVKPVEKPKPRLEKPKPKVVEKPKPDLKKIAEAKKKAADRAAAREAAAAKAAAGKAAAAKAAAKAARAASAARSGGGSGMSVSSWGAKVNAHMQRRKRRGSVSGSGTAVVRFSINSSGGVTSASVARSSGNPSVDSAALALVRGASPVPAPPPGGPHSLTIPIQY